MSISRIITDNLSTPGEILLEEFLEPLGISQYKLAQALCIPQSRVSAIIRGERGITVDTALRLAKFFDTSAMLWMNLQTHYDLIKAQSSIDLHDVHSLTASDKQIS